MTPGLIRPSDFQRLADLAFRHFGIHLPEKKRQLVTNKFSNVLMRRGYDSWGMFIDDIEADSSGRLLLEFADKLTTNHTYFFREDGHFETLAKYVLDVRMPPGSEVDGESLRIWCAGCATGEEAYSLGITLLEHRGGIRPFASPPILATDISFSALKKAKDGFYDSERLKNVPMVLNRRYFKETFPGSVEVKDVLKSAILFKRLNFMADAYPFRRRFQAIFCRNVMIYFNDESKEHVVSRIAGVLEPGGLFFIGHSETIPRPQEFGLESLGSAVYRKEDAQ